MVITGGRDGRQLSEKVNSVEMMSKPKDEDMDPHTRPRWSWYGGIISAQLASEVSTSSLDSIRAPRARSSRSLERRSSGQQRVSERLGIMTTSSAVARFLTLRVSHNGARLRDLC
jgi:hypothetical protein